MAPEIELLDVAELAALCRSGEDWIRRGVQRRTLPHTRIARRILFTRDQVAEILARHAVATQGVPTRDEVAARRAGARQSAKKSPPPPPKKSPPPSKPERTAPPAGPERTGPPSGPKTTEAGAA